MFYTTTALKLCKASFELNIMYLFCFSPCYYQSYFDRLWCSYVKNLSEMLVYVITQAIQFAL